MNKKEMIELLNKTRKEYKKLQDKGEELYQEVMKKLETYDDTVYVFDFIANGYSTARVIAARIELEHAEQEAKELEQKKDEQTED